MTSLIQDMSPLQVVEKATIVTAMIMIFSGIPTAVDCYRRRDVRNFPLSFFIVTLLLAYNGVFYGILYPNTVVVLINSVTSLVTLFYLAIYLVVVNRKLQSLALILFAHVGLLAFYLTIPVDRLGDLVGVFGSLTATVLNILPILEVVRSFQQRDTGAILVPMLLASTANMSMWFMFGYLLNDKNLMIPNVPGLAINVLRFVVVAFYGKSKEQ